jgi:hypothetical protein
MRRWGADVVEHIVAYVKAGWVILALQADSGALRWCETVGAQPSSPAVAPFLPMVIDGRKVYAGGGTGPSLSSMLYQTRQSESLS